MSLLLPSVKGRLLEALAAAVAAGIKALVNVSAKDAGAAAKVAPDGPVAQRVADLTALKAGDARVHLEQEDVQHLIDHLPEDDGPTPADPAGE